MANNATSRRDATVVRTVEQIDSRIDRLKLLVRRLSAERRVSILREKYQQLRLIRRPSGHTDRGRAGMGQTAQQLAKILPIPVEKLATPESQKR
jgi:hypothetical protein